MKKRKLQEFILELVQKIKLGVRHAKYQCRIKYNDICNCINDGSRSTAIAIQVEVANHSKVLYSKGMVLSVREKATYKLSGEC